MLDGSDLDRLTPAARVLRVCALAEGPITLTGVLERPGLRLESQDARAILNNFVTTGELEREDLPGQRCTYKITDKGIALDRERALAPLPSTDAAPSRAYVWRADPARDTQRVLDVLVKYGTIKRSEIRHALSGISQNTLTVCLQRLEKKGLIKKCFPYGSYTTKTEAPQKPAPPKPRDEAAPRRVNGVEALKDRLGVHLPRACTRQDYERCVRDLKRRLQECEAAAKQIDALSIAIGALEELMP